MIGFINFSGDNIPINKNQISHYTAVCYTGNNWIQYDNQEKEPVYLKQISVVESKIIFYLKKTLNE